MRYRRCRFFNWWFFLFFGRGFLLWFGLLRFVYFVSGVPLAAFTDFCPAFLVLRRITGVQGSLGFLGSLHSFFCEYCLWPVTTDDLLKVGFSQVANLIVIPAMWPLALNNHHHLPVFEEDGIWDFLKFLPVQGYSEGIVTVCSPRATPQWSYFFHSAVGMTTEHGCWFQWGHRRW